MENKEITKNCISMVNDMLEKVKTMDETEYQKFLDGINLFHDYSWLNRVILYCHGATNVKGFRQWNAINRSVKRGEKAIWIIAPKLKKVKKEVEVQGKKEVTEKSTLYGFMAVPVFDLAQTEGDPLPEKNLTTQVENIKIESLIKIAEELNFNVSFQEMSYSKGGYIDTENNIVLNSILSERENIGTLIHEISHGLLKHNGNVDLSREFKEQEAETMSYLINSRIGISRESRFYLKTWGVSETIKTSMSKIEKAMEVFFECFEDVYN